MYTATIQDNHHVSWDEFCTAFRGHYLLARTMQRTCGSSWIYNKGTTMCMSASKISIAQNGTHHVDTDGQKVELFRRGLSLLIQDCLVWFQDMSFNTPVCVAIAQDGTYRALRAEEEEKRKRDMLESSEYSTLGAPPKYRLVYTPSAGKP
jgi:hypothetical protein